MKILACHIENFGRLHDFKLDFTDNPTTIFAPNGWGKSTFAAFLKSMFYGLPDNRAKSAESNARLKYKPWGGGAYGGSLVFEHEGKRYVVRKIFGDSAKGDDCKIYDALTQLETADFSAKKEELGTALFGVDERGYEKLAYMPQGSVESRLDGGLQAALLRSRESLDGYEDVESAVDAIEAEEKLLRAKRKPAKGRLDVLDEEIFALEEEIFAAEDAAKKWEETCAYTAQIEQKIEEIKGETRSEKRVQKPKKGGLGISLTGVGAVLVLLGVISLLFPAFPPLVGVSACAIGLVAILAALLVFFTQKTDDFATKEGTKEEQLRQSERAYQEAKHKALWEGQPFLLAAQKLPSLKASLQEKREEKALLEKRAWRLATAKALLIEAKRQSAGNYLSPLTERCQALFEKFYPGKRTVLTAEGEVRLDEAGALREGAYYSAGMRAALGICIRLALLETLFTGEKPPLVLDDPFVDMDEENFGQAKAFLEGVEKEYQIVYLTCHDSRLI